MASFIYKKNEDGSYEGRSNWFGTTVTIIADSFAALWHFFCGKKQEGTMASFIQFKDEDGNYHGRANWAGIVIEFVADSVHKLWELFINRLGNNRIGGDINPRK